jgi:formate dehydrogenase maturation protein FdhE
MIDDWLGEGNDCDWKEDFGHENGRYFCVCVTCENKFMGHKRRHICKTCDTESREDYEKLSDEEKEQIRLNQLKFIETFYKTNE